VVEGLRIVAATAGAGGAAEAVVGETFAVKFETARLATITRLCDAV